MQRAALRGLRDVDLLAAKHCVATVSDAPLVGQLDQQSDGFIGNSILRVVEIKPGGLGEPIDRRDWDRRQTTAVVGCP